MARRNKLEIITHILEICKSEDASKTRVVYQANLNFKNAGIYLKWLTKRGFLKQDGKLYKITPAGSNLLSNLSDISSMINLDLEGDLSSLR